MMLAEQDLLEDGDGAPYPDEVQSAARDVLMRMSGCPDAYCHACQENIRVTLVLIQAAVQAGTSRAAGGPGRGGGE
jgi:hypothetical protein